MTTLETFARTDAAITCAAMHLASAAPALAAIPFGHPQAGEAQPVYEAAHAFLEIYKAQLAASAATPLEATS